MLEKQVKRLFDIPHYQLAHYSKKDALVYKKNGLWLTTSTQNYIEQSTLFALALQKFGLQKGDNIAIIVSSNRTEWHISDMGIQQMGAIVIPIYATISPDDYLYIFNQAEIKLCIVSDESLYIKI